MMNEENYDVKITAESYDEIEYTKKPRSKERGPDKKPRTYRPNSQLTSFYALMILQ